MREINKVIPWMKSGGLRGGLINLDTCLGGILQLKWGEQNGIFGYCGADGIGVFRGCPDSLLAGEPLLWMPEAQQRWDSIPDFIRPMARRQIERLVKERGQWEITAEVVE